MTETGDRRAAAGVEIGAPLAVEEAHAFSPHGYRQIVPEAAMQDTAFGDQQGRLPGRSTAALRNGLALCDKNRTAGNGEACGLTGGAVNLLFQSKEEPR
jgi:hypothetical protein